MYYIMKKMMLMMGCFWQLTLFSAAFDASGHLSAQRSFPTKRAIAWPSLEDKSVGNGNEESVPFDLGAMEAEIRRDAGSGSFSSGGRLGSSGARKRVRFSDGSESQFTVPMEQDDIDYRKPSMPSFNQYSYDPSLQGQIGVRKELLNTYAARQGMRSPEGRLLQQTRERIIRDNKDLLHRYEKLKIKKKLLGKKDDVKKEDQEKLDSEIRSIEESMIKLDTELREYNAELMQFIAHQRDLIAQYEAKKMQEYERVLGDVPAETLIHKARQKRDFSELQKLERIKAAMEETMFE